MEVVIHKRMYVSQGHQLMGPTNIHQSSQFSSAFWRVVASNKTTIDENTSIYQAYRLIVLCEGFIEYTQHYIKVGLLIKWPPLNGAIIGSIKLMASRASRLVEFKNSKGAWRKPLIILLEYVEGLDLLGWASLVPTYHYDTPLAETIMV